MVSDSTYVVNCFRDRWWEGWLKRDWKNSQRKPVANRDLWEPLLRAGALDGRPGDVPLGQGPLGGSWNDRVDELATMAADSGHGSSGDGPSG